MEDNSVRFEDLFKRLENYTNTNIELLKLKTIDKTAEIVSFSLSRLILTIAFSLFFLVFSSGVALWLGELLGKVYYGIFIVSGFYGIVAIILFVSREKIKQNIANSIIKKAFNE
jgi:hypothetical protein